MQTQVTVEQIRSQSYVYGASVWQDRIYINLRGNGGNFAGERTSKVWIKDNILTVQRGKGMTSREWDANLAAVRAWLVSQGVQA